MGSTFSVIKVIIAPAIIALLYFFLVTYFVVPLWHRYRGRYSQYLPLESISNQTTSLRQRLQSAATRLIIPTIFRQRQSRVVMADGETDAEYDSEEGEELGDVDEDRRLELSRSEGGHPDSSRRLSRDLEQGFMDDSDEEIPNQ